MTVNIEALAAALPDDGEWGEDELERLIAQLGNVREPSGMVTGAARAMLVSAKLVIQGQRAGYSGYRYRKNPNPPKPLGFLDAEQDRLDRAVADEQNVLRQINDAQRTHDELLNGPARRAEEAQFRARMIGVLKEFNLIPQDTPLPTVPQEGNRVDYAGPPQPGSLAYVNGHQ